jgi:hypothetical protein
MKTLEKLQLVFELMKKAEEIINDIKNDKDENESLLDYYGYSLEIIKQQLNIFSDNRNGYLTHDTNIKEIVDSEGERWNDESNDDGIDYQKVLDEIYI